MLFCLFQLIFQSNVFPVHFLPQHGARVQFLLGIGVNTPFSKYSRKNLGTVSVPRAKV